MDGLDYYGGLSRAALQGLTFGFADEGEAAIRAALGPNSYGDNLDAIRGINNRFRDEHTGAGITAEIVGGLPTGLGGLARAGAARAAAGAAGKMALRDRAKRMGREAGVAAGYGALYGFGDSDSDTLMPTATNNGRLVDAAAMGVLSAPFGPALGAAQRSLGSAARAAADSRAAETAKDWLYRNFDRGPQGTDRLPVDGVLWDLKNRMGLARGVRPTAPPRPGRKERYAPDVFSQQVKRQGTPAGDAEAERYMARNRPKWAANAQRTADLDAMMRALGVDDRRRKNLELHDVHQVRDQLTGGIWPWSSGAVQERMLRWQQPIALAGKAVREHPERMRDLSIDLPAYAEGGAVQAPTITIGG